MTPYISVADADAFITQLMNSDVWEETQEADKLKALNSATFRIDSLGFAGKKTDESQEHEFPRGGASEVPTPIKQACALIAQALIDGIDPEEEIRNLSVVAQGYSTVKTTYTRDTVPEHILAGIPTAAAWMLIKPYLMSVGTVNLYRVA